MRIRRLGQGRGRERGFTLLEMLIVVALVALITVIMIIAVSRAIKRQRLEVAARQLQSLIEKAYVLQAQNHTGVFVVLNATAGDGTRTVELRLDSFPPDNQLSAAELAAGIIASNQLVLSSDLVVSACNWPALTVGGKNVNVLLCDSVSRTMDPTVNPSTPIANATISLTHVDMTTAPPKLTPRVRYDIVQDRLWHATLSLPIRY